MEKLKGPGEDGNPPGVWPNLVERSDMAQGTCSVPDCGIDIIFARGWCRKHWNKWRRYGDPLVVVREPDKPEKRFWPRVDQSGDCWIWMGRVSPDGYGRFPIRSTNVLSHRFAYEQAHGPIPSGMEVDHLCHTRSCVNPSHLRLVTHKQNMEHHNGPSRANRSGVRGVHWQRNEQRWRVEVNHHGKRYHGGTFTNIKDAEAAVIALRNKLHTHNDLDRGLSVA